MRAAREAGCYANTGRRVKPEAQFERRNGRDLQGNRLRVGMRSE